MPLVSLDLFQYFFDHGHLSQLCGHHISQALWRQCNSGDAAHLFKKKYTLGLKQALMDNSIDFDRMASAFSLNPDATSMVFLPDSLSPLRDDVENERLPNLTAETALENLGHTDKNFRVRAAAYFVENPDQRAIHRLMNRLDDLEWVREVAIEALAGYGEAAQPFRVGGPAPDTIRVFPAIFHHVPATGHPRPGQSGRRSDPHNPESIQWKNGNMF